MEELRIIVVASALAIAGLVLTGLCAAGLGTARAAAKWPSADRPRLGAIPTRIGIGVGVVLSAAAAGVGALLIPLKNEIALYAAVVGAALITLVVIAWLATLLASKVELSALINSPSPGGQEPQNPTSGMGAQAAASSPHGLRPYQQAEISYGRPYPGVVEPPRTSPSVVESLPYETEASTAPPQASVSPSTNEYTSPDYEPQADAYVDPINTTVSSHGQIETQSAQTIGAEAVPGHVTDMIDDYAIPDEAMPGWVYTDDAEDWYLVALIEGGRRLLRLTDFVIPPPGSVTGELHIAGSIEMTVWPAEVEEDEQSDEPAPVDSGQAEAGVDPQDGADQTEPTEDAPPVPVSRLATEADTTETAIVDHDVQVVDAQVESDETRAPEPSGQATGGEDPALGEPANAQTTQQSAIPAERSGSADKPDNSETSDETDPTQTDNESVTGEDANGRHRRSRHRRGIQNFGQ